MIRSRTDPYRVRSGPKELAATIPPSVAFSGCGGSSASRWPFFASSPCNCASVTPHSTVTTWSAGVYSTTRSSRAVEISVSTGGPGGIAVPPPTNNTLPPPRASSASTSSIDPGVTRATLLPTAR